VYKSFVKDFTTVSNMYRSLHLLQFSPTLKLLKMVFLIRVQLISIFKSNVFCVLTMKSFYNFSYSCILVFHRIRWLDRCLVVLFPTFHMAPKKNLDENQMLKAETPQRPSMVQNQPPRQAQPLSLALPCAFPWLFPTI